MRYNVLLILLNHFCYHASQAQIVYTLESTKIKNICVKNDYQELSAKLLLIELLRVSEYWREINEWQTAELRRKLLRKASSSFEIDDWKNKFFQLVLGSISESISNNKMILRRNKYLLQINCTIRTANSVIWKLSKINFRLNTCSTFLCCS